MKTETGPSTERTTAELNPGQSKSFDWTRVRPSTAVVELVAEFADTDPLELPPIYRSIDPDALDALVAPGPGGTEARATAVSFTYGDHDVTVHGDGLVELSSTL